MAHSSTSTSILSAVHYALASRLRDGRYATKYRLPRAPSCTWLPVRSFIATLSSWSYLGPYAIFPRVVALRHTDSWICVDRGPYPQVGPGIRHANIGVPVEHVLYSSTKQAGSLVISSLHENKKDYAQYLHATRILF